MKNTLSHDIKQCINISVPLIVALLAHIGMQLVDTKLMGILGVDNLAAGALATASFAVLFNAAAGLMSVVGIFVSYAYGGKDSEQIAYYLRHGIVMALLVAPIGMLLIWLMPFFLLSINQPIETVALSKEYLYAIIWIVPIMLIFFAQREFVAALEHPHIITVVALLMIPVNMGISYILMLGKFGLPAMGIAGIGYGTVITELLAIIALFAYINKHKVLSNYACLTQVIKINRLELNKMLRFSAPVALSRAGDVGMFSAIALMMGYVSIDALAAHQIAVQCAAAAYMLSVGISQTTALQVGQFIGSNAIERAKRFVTISLSIALILSTFTGFLFLVTPHLIVGLFLDSSSELNAAAFKLAVTYLGIAVAFQYVDSVQVIASAALRGLKDTFVPMLICLFSFWFVGIGVAYLLSFTLGFEGTGLWWGLVIGLAVAALLLYVRFNRSIKRLLV